MADEKIVSEVVSDEILGQLVLDSNAIIQLLIKKGVITEEELNQKVDDLVKEMIKSEE